MLLGEVATRVLRFQDVKCYNWNIKYSFLGQQGDVCKEKTLFYEIFMNEVV